MRHRLGIVLLAVRPSRRIDGGQTEGQPRHDQGHGRQHRSASCGEFWPDDPVAVIGLTQGAYIDGYGAVFMSEVNLAPAAGTIALPSEHHRRRDQAHSREKDGSPCRN